MANTAFTGFNGGRTVQQVQSQLTTVLDATTQIDLDNTIPQKSTEGTEVTTVTITPTLATSILQIDVDMFGACTGSKTGIVAVFQDATEPAIACASNNVTTAGGHVSLSYRMTSGTTSATTFAVNAGTEDGTSWYINGDSGGTAVFLGTSISSITVTEIGPGTGIISTQGQVLQVINSQEGTLDTGATALPYDDTVPQITEGDEYMTAAITPNNSSNKLKIDVVAFLAHSVDQTISGALFNTDSHATNALAAGAITGGAAEYLKCLTFTHYMDAGTTSSTTFRFRAGGASGANTLFNGITAEQKFDGVMASSITITEIEV